MSASSLPSPSPSFSFYRSPLAHVFFCLRCRRCGCRCKPALSTSRSPYLPNLPIYLFIIGCFMRFVYTLHTNILSQIFQRHRSSTDCVCVCYVKNECRTTCNVPDQNRMRCRTHRSRHSRCLSPVRCVRYSLHLFKIVEQVLNFVLVHTSRYRA